MCSAGNKATFDVDFFLHISTLFSPHVLGDAHLKAVSRTVASYVVVCAPVVPNFAKKFSLAGADA
jgi:hypothetical protein